jgi:hypothetical protein
MKQNEYVKACMDRLIPELAGLTITGGVTDDTGEYWGFTARGELNGQSVEKTVFVMADPEGNGSGWLEVNDGIEPEVPAAFTECCPYCLAENVCRENKPFPCSSCGNILEPCFACFLEHGEEIKCPQCTGEARGEEVTPCLQP